MVGLFAVAGDVASIIVDLWSDPDPVPKGSPNWRVPVSFRASENWHLLVNEKLAAMRFVQSALGIEHSRDLTARPRWFLDVIDVKAMTKEGAGKVAAAIVLEAVDLGNVPNWRVELGEAVRV